MNITSIPPLAIGDEDITTTEQLEKVAVGFEAGRYYLPNGLIVELKDDTLKRVGRWEPKRGGK